MSRKQGREQAMPAWTRVPVECGYCGKVMSHRQANLNPNACRKMSCPVAAGSEWKQAEGLLYQAWLRDHAPADGEARVDGE